MIYLDNAATTGTKPQSVIGAVVDGLKNYSSNPGRGGHRTSLEAARKVFEVRSKVCEYFNCDDVSRVCFTANCTASINIVLNGCLKSGDHIIISSLEHNAVLRPLVALKDALNIEIDILEVDINEPYRSADDFKKLLKKNTKMVFLTHASNVFGTLLPIKEIGKICKEKGILFGVDAAQSAGHVPIDVTDMEIDFLCVAPHKGLYAPMGCGILIANRNIENVLIKGGTGVNSVSPYQPSEYPERIESGTINLPGIFGIGAGIEFISDRKMEYFKKREKYLLHFLYKKLKQYGSILYTKDPLIKDYVPVISFNISGKGSEEVAAYLSANDIATRGGLHCAPLAHKSNGTLDTGTVRVSTSVFNTEKDIEKFINIIKKI